MSLILHLGVLDVPYSHTPAARRPLGKARKRKRPMRAPGRGATKSTGDVAEILERKYKIMEFFAGRYMPKIAGELEDAVAGQLENLMMRGGSARASALNFGKAESAIGTMFRTFLDAREMDNRVAGVPTKAALKGVSHRLKHPYRKSNPERASFVDSGLYSASMRAWMEQR